MCACANLFALVTKESELKKRQVNKRFAEKGWQVGGDRSAGTRMAEKRRNTAWIPGWRSDLRYTRLLRIINAFVHYERSLGKRPESSINFAYVHSHVETTATQFLLDETSFTPSSFDAYHSRGNHRSKPSKSMSRLTFSSTSHFLCHMIPTVSMARFRRSLSRFRLPNFNHEERTEKSVRTIGEPPSHDKTLELRANIAWRTYRVSRVIKHRIRSKILSKGSRRLAYRRHRGRCRSGTMRCSTGSKSSFIEEPTA